MTEAEQQKDVRLVLSIAKRYAGRGIDLLTLTETGIRAMSSYREKHPDAPEQEITRWGGWWVRQAITRAIADQTPAVRVPVEMVETVNRVCRTTRRLSVQLGREPSEEELAEALSLPLEQVQQAQELLRNQQNQG